MTRFPRFATIAAFCCLLTIGGCSLTPADRVQLYEQQLTTAQAALTEIQAQTAKFETELAAMQARIEDANIPMEDRQKTWQTAAKIRGVLAGSQEIEADLVEWMTEVRQKIDALQAGGPVDSQGEFNAVGGAIGSAVRFLPPQAQPWALLASIVVPAAGWILSALKRKKVEATATAIVKGIEASPEKAQEAVKLEIEARMKSAGVYDQANAIVDGIKAA